MPEPIYVIMDVDWAHDDVIRASVRLLEAWDLPATIFVTHASPFLDEMRKHPLLQLGVHPNANDLLNGRASPATTVEARLKLLQDLVPEATAIRFHSMCQSSQLLDMSVNLGFTHEVNTLVMAHSGMVLKAWEHWRPPMIRVPTIFEDSLAGYREDGWDVGRLLAHPGLRVYNVHPVRLFLNAISPNPPDAPGIYTASPEALLPMVRSSEQTGSLNFLKRLVEGHRAAGGGFGFIRDIRP